METKTKVLTIDELNQLIPGTKELKSKSFKTIQVLLKALIEAIEKDGQWEFIQYTTEKPSLFIIKKVEKVQATNQSRPLDVSLIKTQIFNEILRELPKYIPSAAVQTVAKSGMVEEVIEKVTEIPYVEPIASTFKKVILGSKEDTLPWEKK